MPELIANNQNTPDKGGKGMEPEKFPNLTNFGTLVAYLSKHKEELTKDNMLVIREDVIKNLKTIVNDFKFSQDQNIVFLMQDNNFDISRSNLDDIYDALLKSDRAKNLLLVLNSPGGSVEPAYLIGKCCKEYSKKFIVAIPRQAKSAATLISLAASEIHMGRISELGPIDPQISKLPALALGEAVSYLASIAEKYPNSADMFARYLKNTLDLQVLGYTQRIAQSAVDYAVRLLGDKSLPLSAEKISDRLVNGYKDHGFVIDKEEAKEILGEIVKYDTEEYGLSDKIYKFIEQFKLALWIVTNESYCINFSGDISEFWFRKIKV